MKINEKFKEFYIPKPSGYSKNIRYKIAKNKMDVILLKNE